MLQFSPWSARDFDDLVRIENELRSLLDSDEIDGHDLGSNEANIFVLTEDPLSVFNAYLPAITAAALLPVLSAGYRALDQDEFVRMWPVGDSSAFSVK